MPPKKKTQPPQDGGISPKERKYLEKGIRQAWQWGSYARKLCIKRATNAEGFGVCESCGAVCPKVFADHIVPMGSFDAGIIDRCFVSSDKLQALCAKCHRAKTAKEAKNRVRNPKHKAS